MVDVDVQPGNGMRVVQLTPPASACSIVIGTGMPEIDKIDEHDQGIRYVPFSDPDGNLWLLQEMPWRSAEFTKG